MDIQGYEDDVRMWEEGKQVGRKMPRGGVTGREDIIGSEATPKIEMISICLYVHFGKPDTHTDRTSVEAYRTGRL